MGNMKTSPVEKEEQIAVFDVCAGLLPWYPELTLLYHIPNGGSRNKAEAAQLKAQGVKPGVSDLCLPVARGKYHGLYIELKRREGGRLSDEQKKWLAALQEQGYAAVRCNGSKEAIDTILFYLKGGHR